MDNDGCWQRKECKLKRDEYLNAGPNSVWNTDGYDKHVEALRFSHSRLHGLLAAAQSNNFPDSVGHSLMQLRHAEDFYLNIIITHQGTENKIMGAI